MRKFLLVHSLLGISICAMAQNTSSTISGIVTDNTGKPLAGASVSVLLESTNTLYRITSLSDGRFTVPNLRVGGPYKVTVSYVGFKETVIDNISLALGQNLPLDVTLSTEPVDLNNVTVSSRTNSVTNNKRTGFAVQITSDQLRNLPTISRSAADFTRLTPSADGISFAGRNSQYNNFSLDGAVFNNPFGLDAATPGGQTDAQPISLDAIEQIQVSIAPYDVTQSGFTGAAVNTVTKSGTNQYKGTVYGFYRNQDLTGKKVKGNPIVVPDLSQTQAGFSIGGPIIKNKLFFFVNAELERRSELGSNYLAARPGLTGSNVSRVTAADLETVSQLLKQRFDYDTGPYEGFTHKTKNQKGLIKLDWIINAQHALTVSYNFLDASRDKPAHPNAIGRRGPDLTTLQFYNSGYRINNKINSFNAELKSNFNSRFANKLRVVYTEFNDSRDPFSTPFPVINIDQGGVRYIVAGHEPFSIHNVLNQYAFQATDNFNVYAKNHTLTFGTSFEKFSFANSFNLTGYGFLVFGNFPSVQAFADSVNKGALHADVQYAKSQFAAGDWNWAYSQLGQFALYAQDEWELSKKFRLTYGVRMDRAMYFDTKNRITPNKDDVTYYDPNGNPVKLDNTKLPDQKPLISPRLGFNYDVNGNRSVVIRGGSGLFTGRLPFVWVGNQVANPFTGYLNITAPDFKWPQVWRNNLGFDYRTKNGWVASLDVIYTKDVKAMMVRNYALGKPTGHLNGPDQRLVYLPSDKVIANGGLANAYVFTNVNTGKTFNITAQVQRFFTKGWYAMLGYNYLLAKDASSISAEISGDAFDRNPALNNVNEPRSTPSLYGNQHRFNGAAYKQYKYGSMATTVSVFFQYAKGGRFTYTYSGDINSDGSPFNDLLYIPTDNDLNNMTFSGDAAAQATQKEAFKSYILQDKYLSKHRGQYAEKYAILSPWYSEWDVRVLQDFYIKAGKHTHTIQFSADLLNAGNLLSSKWGVRQYPLNQQPVGVSIVNNTPVYSFDASQRNTFVNDFSLLSRWQLQLGLRYIF